MSHWPGHYHNNRKHDHRWYRNHQNFVKSVQVCTWTFCFCFYSLHLCVEKNRSLLWRPTATVAPQVGPLPKRQSCQGHQHCTPRASINLNKKNLGKRSPNTMISIINRNDFHIKTAFNSFLIMTPADVNLIRHDSTCLNPLFSPMTGPFPPTNGDSTALRRSPCPSGGQLEFVRKFVSQNCALGVPTCFNDDICHIYYIITICLKHRI